MTTELVVVLVRGMVNTKPEVRETLKRLRLQRKNNCIIVPHKPERIGMVNAVKDFVTWGTVTPEVLEKIKKKMVNGVTPLQPPRKGFGRKGIKFQFNRGGALGNRGEKMNDL